MGAAAEDRVAGYLERIRGLAPLVLEHAERSERERQLSPDVVEAFHEAGLFRILLPEDMGGGGLTVPDSLRIFEAVARLDASAGWNLAICADGPLFGHFLAREAYDAIFRDARAIIAGSLNPMNTRVVRCDGGWLFTGKATYVSGSAQASWLMAAGVVLRDGSPELVDGVPSMRAGLFPIRESRILDTWLVSGMRGTSSNDCVFEDVLVPADFTYEWPNPRPTWQRGALANIPLVTQLGGALSSVALGVARHAIDALVELAAVKVPLGARAPLRERSLFHLQLGQAEGLLRAARAYLLESAAEVWRRGEAGRHFDVQAQASARLASVTAAKLAAQAVDLMHDAAGMNAVQTSSALERCWRDVHTITQHVILSTGRYEVIGRVLLGLPPGTPII